MKKLNELALLGDSLREERRLLGMTQEEAAKQFRVSLKALRNLEQGYGGVTLTTAAKIFEHLGKQLRVSDILTSRAQRELKGPRRDKNSRDSRTRQACTPEEICDRKDRSFLTKLIGPQSKRYGIESVKHMRLSTQL